MESLEKKVLDSMKRVLQQIDEKLKDENILEDIKETNRLQNKKKWVEDQIVNWQKFINN